MLVAPISVESPTVACKMVTADGTPLVETCVLIPAEFALKVETQPSVASLLHFLPHLAQRSHLSRPFLDHLVPPPFSPVPPHLGPLAPAVNPLGAPFNRLTMPPAEDCIQVCATRHLPPHTRYLPFSGTVRTDNLPFVPCLGPLDPRQRYGSYDEMCQRAAGQVRLCNWVRFVAPALHFTPQVNMVASRVRDVKRSESSIVTVPPEVVSPALESSSIPPTISFLTHSTSQSVLTTSSSAPPSPNTSSSPPPASMPPSVSPTAQMEPTTNSSELNAKRSSQGDHQPPNSASTTVVSFSGHKNGPSASKITPSHPPPPAAPSTSLASRNTKKVTSSTSLSHTYTRFFIDDQKTLSSNHFSPVDVSMSRKQKYMFSFVEENVDSKECSRDKMMKNKQDKADEEIQLVEESSASEETQTSEQEPACRYS